MSVNIEVRNKLPEGTIILDNVAYDNSIIGLTFDGRLIYDYDKMVKELAYDDDISYEDAIDWIEYNTMRALPYIGSKAPIIVNLCG